MFFKPESNKDLVDNQILSLPNQTRLNSIPPQPINNNNNNSINFSQPKNVKHTNTNSNLIKNKEIKLSSLIEDPNENNSEKK